MVIDKSLSRDTLRRENSKFIIPKYVDWSWTTKLSKKILGLYTIENTMV